MPDYTLTKHRGKLALTYTPEGWDKQRRISTGTDVPAQAEFVASQIWAKLNALESERLIDLWPTYVRDRIKDGARPDRFKAHWTALEPHFGERLGRTITKDDCRKYYQHRKSLGYADSSIRTDIELFRACLRWHYRESAPALWIPPASKPREHWITKDQAKIILATTKSHHVKLFITLALATGARATTITDLTWDRVDFKRGLIDYAPAGRKQTNKRRITVPMNANARIELEIAYRGRLTDSVIEFQGKPVKSVQKSIERLSKETGIYFSQHVFRHTCGVWMANANVPMGQIAQFLGTTVAIAERVYARYSPSFMENAKTAASW